MTLLVLFFIKFEFFSFSKVIYCSDHIPSSSHPTPERNQIEEILNQQSNSNEQNAYDIIENRRMRETDRNNTTGTNESESKSKNNIKSNVQSNINRQASDYFYKNKQQNINVQSFPPTIPIPLSLVGGSGAPPLYNQHS